MPELSELLGWVLYTSEMILYSKINGPGWKKNRSHLEMNISVWRKRDLPASLLYNSQVVIHG